MCCEFSGKTPASSTFVKVRVIERGRRASDRKGEEKRGGIREERTRGVVGGKECGGEEEEVGERKKRRGGK